MVDDFDSNCDLAVSVGELEWVGQEVEENLDISTFVTVYALDQVHIVLHVDFGLKMNSNLAGIELEHVQSFIHSLTEVEELLLEDELVIVPLGQIKQVVD